MVHAAVGEDMSTGSAILALLSGMNQGKRDAAERQRADAMQRRAEQRADLMAIASLLGRPGFSVGGGAAGGGSPQPSVPAVPPPGATPGAMPGGMMHGAGQTPPPGLGAPRAPSAPGLSSGPLINLPANPVGLRSPALAAADAALRGAPDTPAAPNAPAAPAAPSSPPNVVSLGELMMGGVPRSITFDPSATPAARAEMERTQRDSLNRRAYAELDADEPGSQGEYDPDFDYVTEARKQRDVKRYEEFLTTQRGYSPSDARAAAEFHVDVEGKRRGDEELRIRRQEAAQRETAFRAKQSEQRVAELADEAGGYLASGMAPTLLGQTLKAMHPEADVSDITRAVGMARNAAELQAATVAQRTRSGSGSSGTLNIGGIEIDPSTLGAGKDTTTPAAALPALSPEDRAKAQQDPQFAAWLRSRGYKL